MALCHAQQTPEFDDPHHQNPNPASDGVTLADENATPDRPCRVAIRALGYADDINSTGKSNRRCSKYAQAMVTILGCLNTRVQGKKNIYLRSSQAAAIDETCDATPRDIQQLAHQTTSGPPLTPTGNLATTIINLDPACFISKRVTPLTARTQLHPPNPAP